MPRPKRVRKQEAPGRPRETEREAKVSFLLSLPPHLLNAIDRVATQGRPKFFEELALRDPRVQKELEK